MFAGTQGYADQADVLIPRYESIPFTHKYRAELALLPTTPGLFADIGAGTGADAAWLCTQGHRVVAVEPTARLREAGRALHPSPAIEWLDDGLPGLSKLVARGALFDAMLITAVWMHLDAPERRHAMQVVAPLLRPGGLLLMSLRHGAVPAGRRMFEVGADETVDLARPHGLHVALQLRVPSLQPENQAAGIAWTRLALRRGSGVA